MPTKRLKTILTVEITHTTPEDVHEGSFLQIVKETVTRKLYSAHFKLGLSNHVTADLVSTKGVTKRYDNAVKFITDPEEYSE